MPIFTKKIKFSTEGVWQHPLPFLRRVTKIAWLDVVKSCEQPDCSIKIFAQLWDRIKSFKLNQSLHYYDADFVSAIVN